MSDPYAAVAAQLSDTAWRKSSFSGPDGNCVECAQLPDGTVAVRNSNSPEAGVLAFTRPELAAWILGCRAGEFDDLAT
ncbi:DUF397 domain-containing protein [Nocardia transvalensis]|uniref:DUF397 domain-containing protein n=1 Tax=Nocardia transvalensis TaxID=37333 RepID=UPI0018933C5D|nr:DUF397 domain-containing protein [Nocardia transvalensis]MBF6332884.1 DUF397 domain-containing protein [Nocardia transvalensis]